MVVLICLGGSKKEKHLFQGRDLLIINVDLGDYQWEIYVKVKEVCLSELWSNVLEYVYGHKNIVCVTHKIIMVTPE